MSELEEYLQCPICQDTYSEPKQLSCGHAFCQQCLSGTQSLYSINCAVCRKATYLSVPGLQGVSLLPTNYPLAQIVHFKSNLNLPSASIQNTKSGNSNSEATICDACAISIDPKEAWLCSSCDARLFCSKCVLSEHRLHTFERLYLQPRQWQTLCKQFDHMKSEWCSLAPLAPQLQDTCKTIQAMMMELEGKEVGLCELTKHVQSVISEGESLRYQRLTPTTLLKLKQAVGKLDCTVTKCKQVFPKTIQELESAETNLCSSFAMLSQLTTSALEHEAMQLSSQMHTVLITWPASDKTTHVCLAGTFTKWKPSIQLIRHTSEFVTTLSLPNGNHQLKFIVDDQWLTNSSMQTCPDGKGGVNNVITI